MLSINMRIFKAVLLLVAFSSNRAECLSIANDTSIVESSSPTQPPYNSTIDHYDQRQNGTENYRIHVDGLIFVVAPVDTLLLAGATAADNDNKPNLPIIDPSKPSPSKPEVETKPSPAPKSAHRAGQRFANLLIPLLRRIRQD